MKKIPDDHYWLDALKYVMASNIYTGGKAKLYVNGKLVSMDGNFTIKPSPPKDEGALTITPTAGELTPGDVFSSSNGKTYKVKSYNNGTVQVEEIDNGGTTVEITDKTTGEAVHTGALSESDLLKKVSERVSKSLKDTLDAHANKVTHDEFDKAAKSTLPNGKVYDPFAHKYVTPKPKEDPALVLADKIRKSMRDDDPVPEDLELENNGDIKIKSGFDNKEHAEEIVKAFKETGSIPGHLYPFADPDSVYELCPEAYEFMKQDQLKNSRFYEPEKEKEKPGVVFDNGDDD
jgi:hypothetical protein